MSEMTLIHPMPQTDTEYEAAIEQMLAEARRLSEQAQRDQNDIERLRAQSTPLRAEIRALLTSVVPQEIVCNGINSFAMGALRQVSAFADTTGRVRVGGHSAAGS